MYKIDWKSNACVCQEILEGNHPFFVKFFLLKILKWLIGSQSWIPLVINNTTFIIPPAKYFLRIQYAVCPSQFITKEGVSVSRLGIGIIHNLEPFLYVDALVMEREIVRDSDERFSFP
jgi:hypothetical protein